MWQVTPEDVGDKLVVSELRQAIGRARLVRKPSRVVLWTSQYIAGVTERAILFDETDWQQAGGNLEKLQAVVTAREQAEQSGDVDVVMESAGVLQRKAYLITKDARDAEKADLKAKAKEMRADGVSIRKIAAALTDMSGKKVSRGKVEGLLKS